MFRWLTSRLPKRVIRKGAQFYPQIWFIWWHYSWESIGIEAITQCGYAQLDTAISEVQRIWGKRKPVKRDPIKVVWSGK